MNLSSPTRFPGALLIRNAVITSAMAAVFLVINSQLEPTFSFYLAQAAMYATAMFGMVILVGLSGQVSLGNGALMAVGAYTFALTSLNWETVPLLGAPWNAVWSVVAAGLVGIVAGLIIGGLGARLTGPYLAGLTLGVAVGLPAIIYRFPDLLGGEDGFALRVPYPSGGYGSVGQLDSEEAETVATDSVQEDAFEEFLSEGENVSESNGAGEVDEFAEDEVLEFDQDELADESLDEFDQDEVLEFDQDELADESLDEFAEDEVLEFDQEPSVDEGDGQASSTDSSAMSSGADGQQDSVTAIGDAGFILEQWQASLAILMAAIVGFVALNLIRSQTGRKWKAVRDDAVAASVVGISAKTTKVSAFVISGFFAALAGAIMAQIFSYVGPALFAIGLSLSLLVGVILGGRASLVGAMIGAAFIVMLPEVVRAFAQRLGWSDQVAGNLPDLIYGLLVVVVVLLLPGGLVGAVIATRRRRASK